MLDCRSNSTKLGRGFNPNSPKHLARIILMHEKDKSLSKSQPVAKGMVKS